MKTDPGTHILERCTVQLKDGRTIDLSGLTVSEAIVRLRAAGVNTTEQIDATVHIVDVPLAKAD